MANPTGKGGFKKGQSGNPKGRVAGTVNARKELEKLAGKYKISPFEFWFKTLNNSKATMKIRLASSKLIVQYMYGKPKETVDMNHTNNPLDDMLKKIYQKNDLKKDK